MILRTVSTIRSKVSSDRLSGWGPSHLRARLPAMFTQQRAPMRSARASRAWHSAIASRCSRRSGLMGLLQAPTSAITTSARSAARRNARTVWRSAASSTGQ